MLHVLHAWGVRQPQYYLSGIRLKIRLAALLAVQGTGQNLQLRVRGSSAIAHILSNAWRTFKWHRVCRG